VRDIAAVAAKALSGGEHDGMTYDLNGPEALTCGEVADKIARHSGSAARYVDVTVEAQRKAMLGLGMPEWQVTALLELQDGWERRDDGRHAGESSRAPASDDGSVPRSKCSGVSPFCRRDLSARPSSRSGGRRSGNLRECFFVEAKRAIGVGIVKLVQP
jgi:hypothetical protein